MRTKLEACTLSLSTVESETEQVTGKMEEMKVTQRNHIFPTFPALPHLYSHTPECWAVESPKRYTILFNDIAYCGVCVLLVLGIMLTVSKHYFLPKLNENTQGRC